MRNSSAVNNFTAEGIPAIKQTEPENQNLLTLGRSQDDAKKGIVSSRKDNSSKLTICNAFNGPDVVWAARLGLMVNQPLLQLGILAVMTKDMYQSTKLRTQNNWDYWKHNFVLGSRTLHFFNQNVSDSKKLQPPIATIKKGKELLNKQIEFMQKMDAQESDIIADAIQNILSDAKIVRLTQDYVGSASRDFKLNDENKALSSESITENMFFNASRRDEVFFSFSFEAQQKLALFYVCPWLSMGTKLPSFDGFERFATAMCMFGASLQGQDQLGQLIPLIKHNIVFHPTQKIIDIVYHSELPHPYEEHLFREFEKFVVFVSKCGNSNVKQLDCHVPIFDYVLSGVELFIRGRITLEALDKELRFFLQKKEEYGRKIREICDAYCIQVKIVCPFDNIFASVYPVLQKISAEEVTEEYIQTASATEEYIIAKTILNTLDVSLSELDPELDDETRIINERKLVRKCLQKLLQNNSADSLQQKVWRDFLSITIPQKTKKESKGCFSLTDHLSNFNGDQKDVQIDEKNSSVLSTANKITSEVPIIDTINNLEELFKIANAVMLACTAHGALPNKTCSWLPLSEKQIQISYANFIKILKKMSTQNLRDYPSIVNLTYLDNLIGYASNNQQGLPFFFGQCMDKLSDLVKRFGLIKSDRSIEGNLNSSNISFQNGYHSNS